MSGNPLKNLAELDVRSLSAYRVEILAAMILLAFGFFYYQFLHTPLARDVAALDARTKVLNSEITTIKAEIAMIGELRATLDEEKKRLELTTSRLESLKNRLPTDKQVSEILSDLSSSDFKGGVRIVSIRPLDPEVEGELTRLPYQVNMEGGFREFGGYIERLEGMDRVMVVDNLMLESREVPAGGATTGGGETRRAPGIPTQLSSQLYLSTYILGGLTR